MKLTGSGPATIGTVFDFLLGPGWARTATPAFLRWPPDAFAVAAMVLQESGGYVDVLRDWPPDPSTRRAEWARGCRADGAVWRETAGRNARPPVRVVALWSRVRAAAGERLSACPGNTGLTHALLELVALADEACAGVGMPPTSVTHGKSDPFQETVSLLLAGQLPEPMTTADGENGESPSTLCRSIDPSKVIVLPKARTPDNGITLRSLTHHLALVRACGIRPRWAVLPEPEAGSRREHSLNLLLVPWPRRVRPIQFQPVAEARLAAGPADTAIDRHRYFTFAPETDGGSPDQVAAEVGRLCEVAAGQVGEVDGVVFPEMALNLETFFAVEAEVRRRGIAFVVAGVYDGPDRRPDDGLAENYACIAARYNEPDTIILVSQRKHHRWFLDDRQICNYGLGSQLQTTKKWWERTVVGDRELNFVAASDWMTFTVLICEDLARVEPAGEVVRAVGPNLVLALLQDGPQLASRWPARAAHPLADDPGCSVLTLTGLGMTELMRPPAGKSRSRAVAMWRDRNETVEIELPPNDDAVVICLTNRYERQWTADGRHDDGYTGSVGLAGYYGVRLAIDPPSAASTPVLPPMAIPKAKEDEAECGRPDAPDASVTGRRAAAGNANKAGRRPINKKKVDRDRRRS